MLCCVVFIVSYVTYYVLVPQICCLDNIIPLSRGLLMVTGNAYQYYILFGTSLSGFTLFLFQTPCCWRHACCYQTIDTVADTFLVGDGNWSHSRAQSPDARQICSAVSTYKTRLARLLSYCSYETFDRCNMFYGLNTAMVQYSWLSVCHGFMYLPLKFSWQ